MLTDQKKLILIVQKRGKRERCFLRVAKSKNQKWNSFNIRACTTKDRVKTTELRLRLARDGERKGWKKIRMIIIQHRHQCNLFAETEAVIRHCWSFSNCVTFIINKKNNNKICCIDPLSVSSSSSCWFYFLWWKTWKGERRFYYQDVAIKIRSQAQKAEPGSCGRLKRKS